MTARSLINESEYLEAADRCIASAAQLQEAVGTYGLTLEHAVRLANLGALPAKRGSKR